MADVLTLGRAIPRDNKIRAGSRQHLHSPRRELVAVSSSSESWVSLQLSLRCGGRFSCLFSDNRKQEQARKALESALGGKKTEFEKWDKEIKRREEAGGGGNSGGGGWFIWRRWFGDGDHFWQEAQQASLTILGILLVYLIIAKGDLMLAVVVNPLLFTLRWTRTVFSLVTSRIISRINPSYRSSDIPPEEVPAPVSAKDSVVGKWGSG